MLLFACWCAKHCDYEMESMREPTSNMSAFTTCEKEHASETEDKKLWTTLKYIALMVCTVFLLSTYLSFTREAKVDEEEKCAFDWLPFSTMHNAKHMILAKELQAYTYYSPFDIDLFELL